MAGFRRSISGALVAVLLALPAAAGADTKTTFGANLQQRSPNSTATCGYPPYYPGFFALASSCTFFTSSTPGGQSAEAQIIPLPDPAVHGNQKGKITAVRVETGPYQAGPAKLTVLRAHRHYDANEATCCIGQAESAQFTLTPNSIVNVTTDLPVASTYDAAQRIYTYDILALTVLDATTPIPADFSGGQYGYCSTGYLPFVQTGQERFQGDYNVCGFVVLMQADLTIDGPDPPPTGTKITFPTAKGRIAGRAARVPLECAGDAVCEGILRLQNVGAGQATTAVSKRAKKTVTYATGKFKIAAKSRGTVKAKLTKRGRRFVRNRKKARVYANVTLGGSVFSKKISLKTR